MTRVRVRGGFLSPFVASCNRREGETAPKAVVALGDTTVPPGIGYEKSATVYTCLHALDIEGKP
jgi:hypothetical protein